MNEQNFDYLKDNVKYLGFGEKQQAELQQHLSAGKEGFEMNFSTEINRKKFEATLRFRKSDSTDMYSLNNYRATLERSNGEKMEHTFYLNKGKGVTAKEAFNLLDGRSVFKELHNKEGQPYKAWLQLDVSQKDERDNFKMNQFHENYGYDLKAELEKLPLVEMDGAENQEALINSLQKGNIQSVRIEQPDASEKKYFLEANPQYKSVNMYDEKMVRLDKDQKVSLEQPQSKIQQGSQQVEQVSTLEKDKNKSAKQAPASKPIKKSGRKKAAGV